MHLDLEWVGYFKVRIIVVPITEKSNKMRNIGVEVSPNSNSSSSSAFENSLFI